MTQVLLGKGLLLAFVFIVGSRRTSAGNYTDGHPTFYAHKLSGNTHVLYSLIVHQTCCV